MLVILPQQPMVVIRCVWKWKIPQIEMCVCGNEYQALSKFLCRNFEVLVLRSRGTEISCFINEHSHTARVRWHLGQNSTSDILLQICDLKFEEWEIMLQY